jgi:hypothetical protein
MHAIRPFYPFVLPDLWTNSPNLAIVLSRREESLADELLKRRRGFCDGAKIALADGQLWTIPAPPTALEGESGSFGTEYFGLIQALREAETTSELRLAELALAIFLLGENYSLSALEYDRLLRFMPGSRELTEWQNRFHRIAVEHLESMVTAATADDHVDRGPLVLEQGWFVRLLSWVRSRLPWRWWLFNS